MHEMGIAMEIVEIATASIPENMKDVKVEKVNLRVGKLSAIVAESLKFCFEIIISDTPLAGAKLKIEEVPVLIRCNECAKEFIIENPVFRCKNCNSSDIKIISGRELEILSIEIAEK